MAVTYFGQCDSSGNPTSNDGNNGGAAHFIMWNTLTYACPGSGDQTIRQVSAYAWDGDATDNITCRFGIYDTSGNLVVDCGTAALSNTSAGWQSVGDGSTSDLGTLTGGTSYKIAVAFSRPTTGYPALSYTTGTLGDGSRTSGTDYAAGMPASFPAPEYNHAGPNILRVGVESAATSQYARPSSDVADGNWLNESSSNTNLYASIDETSANDSDYIRSGATPSNDTCTVGLSSISAPTSGTVTLRIRAKYV